MALEDSIVYFETTGRDNSDAVLQIAARRAAELGIKTIIVASTKGYTAVKAVEALQGFKVIIVGHVHGYSEPNLQTFKPEHRRIVESKGGTIIHAAHAFAGLSRALRHKYNMFVLGEVMADTLRIFGHGTKVACEIAMMATDAGLVSSGEDVIAIGGTGSGADTALVVRAANTHRFFELKVLRVLCKPLLP